MNFSKVQYKLLVFTIILVGFTLSGVAEKKVLLKELVNPDSIKLDDKNIYITDNALIHIYSVKDLRLKNQFGKIGEGPGEFLGNAKTTRAPLDIYLTSKSIVVYSYNKVSYFDKKGVFKKELRTQDRSTNFKPLGSGYAGRLMIADKKMRYRTLNIYDSKLKGLTTVTKVPHPLKDRKRGFRMAEAPMAFATYKNRLYAAFDEDLVIKVFDVNGKYLYSIKHDYDRIKVTQTDKDKLTNFIKTHPRFKSIRNYLLPLYFPERFPALLNMLISDGKIYAISGKNKNGKNECFTFALDGKLLKRKIVNLAYKNEFDLSPHYIKNDTLYQLVEDEENEKWNLLISKL